MLNLSTSATIVLCGLGVALGQTTVAEPNLLGDFKGCRDPGAIIGNRTVVCGGGPGTQWTLNITATAPETVCFLSSVDLDVSATANSSSILIQDAGLSVLSSGPGDCFVRGSKTGNIPAGTYSLDLGTGGDSDTERAASEFAIDDLVLQVQSNPFATYTPRETDPIFRIGIFADTTCTALSENGLLTNPRNCSGAQGAAYLGVLSVQSSNSTASPTSSFTSTSSIMSSTSPAVGSTTGTPTGSPTRSPTSPSHAARRKRRILEGEQAALMALQQSSCPAETRQCAVVGAAKDVYECIEIDHELNSCGGCIADESGVDCESLPHVAAGGVQCQRGVCTIFSCQPGYATNGTSCDLI